MSGREALRNNERLYFKFLNKYFEGLHHDLYEQADALYQQAKKNNPGVKDLTKTIDFMTAVTPELDIPRYYKARQRMNVAPTTPERTTREMVLRVELVDVQDLHHHTSTAPVLPTVSQQEPHGSATPVCLPNIETPVPLPTVSQQEPHGSTAPVSLPNIETPVPLPTVSQQEPHGSTAPVSLPNIDYEPLPPLSPSTYKDLLFELHNDPELGKIFDEYPSFTNDDREVTNDSECMNEDVWNTINNDITPLEMELANY